MRRLAALALLVLSAAPAHAVGTPDAPAGMLKVQASIEAARDGQRGITVRGATNLPDGTRLLVVLVAPNGMVIAQDEKVVVAASAFRAGPFYFQGRVLPAGSYVVEVVSQVGAYQPAHVSAVLGPRGEHMTGPTVKADRQGRHLSMRQMVAVP